MKNKIYVLILCISMFLLNIIPASANGTPISVDGYYDDWNDKPGSFHYNWDNSQNCWNGGEWADTNNDGIPEQYITAVNTFDNNVRHYIQLHSDDNNIYVHIKIAKIYGSKFNGEDYQFTFNNGQRASFQITDQNGQVITNEIGHYPPGVHNVQVRHRDGACSYSIAENSQAKLTVYGDRLYTDLEFSIPLSTCVIQNPNIDVANLEVITFFTPNLMYHSIETHGTPTLFYSILIGAGIAVIAQKGIKKKRGMA